tara:strand:+ start:1657 stop:3480 length:1824 start_codon:yes stop_codon:yes gene_type:complete
MARVPTPATQGAQNLGSVQARTSKMQFQNVSSPVMNGTANLAGQISQGLSGIEGMADAIDAKNADAFLLETQRNITTYRQDQVTGWGSPAMGDDGTENGISALGANANRAWATGREDDFKKMSEKVSGDKRYQGLSEERRLAIDSSIQTQSLAHRAQVMSHWQGQADAALEAEEKAAVIMAKDEAIALSTSPDLATSSLTGMISRIGSQGERNGYPLSDEKGVTYIAAQAELDDTVNTAVQNLLATDNVEGALEYLFSNDAITVDGTTVKLTANMKQDLKKLISDSESGSKSRQKGVDLFVRYGDDGEAAKKALTGSSKNNAEHDAAWQEYGRLKAEQKASKAAAVDEIVSKHNADAAGGRLFTPAEEQLFYHNGGSAAQWNSITSISLDARGASPIIHNPASWSEFLAMSSSEMVELGINGFNEKYGSSMDKQHRESGESMIHGYANSSASTVDSKFTSIGTVKQQVDNVFNKFGLKNKTTNQKKLYAGFIDAVNADILSLESQLNGSRKATPAEINEIVEGHSIRVKVDDWFTDPEKFAFEVEPEDRNSAYVPYESVPDANKKVIMAALSEHGIEGLDEELIGKIYAAILLGNNDYIDTLINEAR